MIYLKVFSQKVARRLFSFVVISLLLGFCNNVAKAQQQTIYVLIDGGVKYNRVLASKYIFNKKYQINVLNVYLNNKNIILNGCGVDTILVAFSLLPDKVDGVVKWEKRNKVDGLNVIRLGDYVQQYIEGNLAICKVYAFRRLNVVPVIKQDGLYYSARGKILMETYFINNNNDWFIGNKVMSINVNSRIYSEQNFKDDVAKYSSYYKVSDNAAELSLLSSLDGILLLKKPCTNACEFWVVPTLVLDGSLSNYGSEGILYKMGIGVLSGNYYEYFGVYRDSDRNNFFNIDKIFYNKFE